MDISEIKELVEYFKKYIPVGPGKKITLKTAMNIESYVKYLSPSGELIKDFAEFDRYFYNTTIDLIKIIFHY